jgi:hypothetical protein
MLLIIKLTFLGSVNGWLKDRNKEREEIYLSIKKRDEKTVDLEYTRKLVGQSINNFFFN